METFWAIVIGALFVIAVAVLVFLGARYLRQETHHRRGEGVLDSSANKPERDRREHYLSREQEGGAPDLEEDRRSSGSSVRVYRH